MPYTVYDKDGNQGIHNHFVDAKEAVVNGNWFFKDPTKKVVVEPVPEPVIQAPGQDIDPIETNIGTVAEQGGDSEGNQEGNQSSEGNKEIEDLVPENTASGKRVRSK